MDLDFSYGPSHTGGTMGTQGAAVLLPGFAIIDSKTRWQDSCTFETWPISFCDSQILEHSGQVMAWCLVIDGWGISFEIALQWLSLNLANEKSTLVR